MTPMKSRYAKAIADLKHRWGDKFVEPKVTDLQRFYFGDRVEVVSPYGYTRRGYISITTGWQPSLLLIGRRGQHGSSDLINEKDIIVAWIDSKSRKHPVPHDALQVAVYIAQREVA